MRYSKYTPRLTSDYSNIRTPCFFLILIFCCFCFVLFFCFVLATTVPQEQNPRSVSENSCNFTSSYSWRRRFNNNNNNSKKYCFKNQRWQNYPFSSKQKSGHLVPVSEWWVWPWLSWETFLLTVPCQRQALSLALVRVGLGSARWLGFFFFFFFAAEYSYSSSCQQCGYSSIRLLVAALLHIHVDVYSGTLLSWVALFIP